MEWIISTLIVIIIALVLISLFYCGLSEYDLKTLRSNLKLKWWEKLFIIISTIAGIVVLLCIFISFIIVVRYSIFGE